MKAKRRTLICLLVLVLAAGGALLALTNYNNKAEEAASAAEEGTISLSSFAAEDLSQITYTYDGETITLNYTDGAWTLAGDEAYHLDSTACNTMVTALSALNAKRQLTAQTGEDYGFDAPLVTVTVTAAGETNTFTFGAQNEITGDIYLQKEGDDSVYTVAANKASCFELGKTDLFEAFNPAGITSSDIESVSYTLAGGETVELAAMSEPAETEEADEETAASSDDTDSAETTESESSASSEVEYTTVWRLVSDTSIDLDDTRVDDILSALSSYVSAQTTDADPAQYGFDAPLVTVTVTTDEDTAELTYTIGTDGYYMMVTGDSSVYQVDETTVQALLYTAQELAAAEEAE